MASHLRFNEEWNAVENWDTLDAWGIIFPQRTQATFRQSLTNLHITPSEVANLNDDMISDLLRETTFANKAAVMKMVKFLRLPKKEGQRKVLKFLAKLPIMEDGNIMEFLRQFSQFQTKEQVTKTEIFPALLQCVPELFLDQLQARKTDLNNKPWDEIRDEVRKILEPGKNMGHYREEFHSLAPQEGELLFKYNQRFNTYCSLLEPTDEAQSERYLNSMPPHVKNWIRTVGSSNRAQKPYTTCADLQDLIAGHYEDPLTAVLISNRTRKRPAVHPAGDSNPDLPPPKHRARCSICHSRGHTAETCTRQGPPRYHGFPGRQPHTHHRYPYRPPAPRQSAPVGEGWLKPDNNSSNQPDAPATSIETRQVSNPKEDMYWPGLPDDELEETFGRRTMELWCLSYTPYSSDNTRSPRGTTTNVPLNSRKVTS